MISKSEYLEWEKELLETKRLIAQQTSELNILVSQEKNLKERLNAFQSQKHHAWNDKKKTVRDPAVNARTRIRKI
ncbi:hypothetical protein [Arsenophonus endosymbiont of Aleurodicus floccissimus]|uniref:hypothetical protein n=1 Tax=Arsenophonus endosymbiont of Aleurodicus floccissimus TaxID=2152761 RepID=UPI0034E21D15